ncbi:MAG: uridine diphosphate-N-acetylglucosamine-binding protein YvcK [Anaerolineae bacterium]
MEDWKATGLKLRKYVHFAIRWLPLGIGIKRWLLLLACGVVFLSIGFGFLLKGFYPPPNISYYLTLQFMPRGARVGLFALVGVIALLMGLIGLNLSLLRPFVDPDTEALMDTLRRYRRRESGPRIVAIGGGHGLSTLLRGLKERTSNITAIVTVADDGGSSGRLRRDLGVLPPGDFRNCIAALADDEALTTHLFQYRFGNGSGLDGHSFGNLFITAMAEVTGSFERAILESGRVLAVQGKVLPSTLCDVTLTADLRPAHCAEDESLEPVSVNRISGESSIPEARGTIQRVYLNPGDAPAYPGAIHALLNADLIVVGPGSLYTSVLPNLLVPGVAQAAEASRGRKIYVCNVATQRGETEGYTVADHVAALEAHVPGNLFPVVLANDNLDVDFESSPGVQLVAPEVPPGAEYRVVRMDLVDKLHPWRHDSNRLARALLRLLEDTEVFS